MCCYQYICIYIYMCCCICMDVFMLNMIDVFEIKFYFNLHDSFKLNSRHNNNNIYFVINYQNFHIDVNILNCHFIKQLLALLLYAYVFKTVELYKGLHIFMLHLKKSNKLGTAKETKQKNDLKKGAR